MVFFKNLNVSIIIPTLNEGKCIGKVLEELIKKYNYEIIIVDGNSRDDTVKISKGFGVKVLFQEEPGFGSAIKTGLMAAKGEIIVCMDGDGSQDIKDIIKLVNLVNTSYDVAFASRYLPGGGSKDDTIIRYLGNRFFSRLVNFLYGVKLSDSLFFFFAIKKSKMEFLDLKSNGFEYCVEVPIKVHKKKLKYIEIPSFESRRIAGKSKLNAFYHGLKILFFILRINLVSKISPSPQNE
jgi:glycosyltransferase involved in cell wall biosynthesis